MAEMTVDAMLARWPEMAGQIDALAEAAREAGRQEVRAVLAAERARTASQRAAAMAEVEKLRRCGAVSEYIVPILRIYQLV